MGERGDLGCRSLIDYRRSPRARDVYVSGRRRHLSLRRLGLVLVLAIPVILLSLGAALIPAQVAPVITASSPVSLSGCAVDSVQCEVEIALSALPDRASVRLIDGPVSLAPVGIIGIPMTIPDHTAREHGATVSRPEMLHVYFCLPHRHQWHWRLIVRAAHRLERSFAIPTLRAASGAL